MYPKSRWFVFCGAVLVFCSMAIMLILQISTNNAQKRMDDMVAQIERVLPSESIGVTDNFSSMQMPSFELDGKNIIAVLQIPDLNVKLPIGSSWNKRKLTSFPQRFSGTVYDGSLVIGGCDREGQFDCLKKMDVGNTVTVTDMTGAKFSYTVDYIERKKSAKAEILNDGEYDLSLFVRESYSTDYIIVRCKQSF